MARGALIVAGIGVLAIAGVAIASKAKAEPAKGPLPPAPAPRGGMSPGTPKPAMRAQDHYLYDSWLHAAETCDAMLAAVEGGQDDAATAQAAYEACAAASRFASQMVADGVAPGTWR
jgi:hypothetical protein